MNRCLKSFLPGLLAAAALAGLWTAAQAQTVRQFPATALRGLFEVTAPPEIEMNGKAERLSPGARIRSTTNMMVMPASLVGQRVLVNYVRNPSGQVHEVWILTEDEIREKRPGLETVYNFRFGSEVEGQPKRDDGKTPFHELPRNQPKR